VNKTKFLELVKNPDLIEEQDLDKLDELISEHPYSQIIHILKVKGYKVFNRPDFDNSLHLAATYAYDRNILKAILEGPGLIIHDSAIESVAVPEADDAAIEEVSDFSWIHEAEDEDIFVEEITETESPENQDNTIADPTEEEDKPQPVPEQKEQNEQVEQLEVENESTEAETEAIAEASAETEEETPPKPGEDAGVTGEDATGPLELEIEASSIHAELMKNLSQLQESKKQYDQEPNQRKGQENKEEQIKIIDDYIKNSPVLSKPGLNAESEGTSQDDLSEKSGKLSGELITENLARIYLKQGKGKDAEKIYKKLIVKFPQKKAYFADQIQKIKKK
jgi:hypothetical protein